MSYKKNTVSHITAKANADRPKPTFLHCKKPGHYRNISALLKRQKEQSENTQIDPGNKNSGAKYSIPSNKTNKNNNKYKNSDEPERKLKTVYPLCETCGKTNHSTEKFYYGANSANRPAPRHRRPE